MKRSDIGPFGVITLLLTLLIQVAALAQAPHRAVAVTVAVVTGRLAVTWACREGVPPARPEGLGALVARTVRRRDAGAVPGAGPGGAGSCGGARAGRGTRRRGREPCGGAPRAVVLGTVASSRFPSARGDPRSPRTTGSREPVRVRPRQDVTRGRPFDEWYSTS